MKKLIATLFSLLLLSSCSANNSESLPATISKETSDSNEEAENIILEDKSTETSESIYHKISANKALEMIESLDDFVLLDVRTDEEYKELRIDGAILIPDFEIVDRAEAELLDKDAIILIYCRSGRRSAIVAEMLASMGYTNIYDFGGILDWPYDTVSG